jgi:hypothetical protein
MTPGKSPVPGRANEFPRPAYFFLPVTARTALC